MRWLPRAFGLSINGQDFGAVDIEGAFCPVLYSRALVRLRHASAKTRIIMIISDRSLHVSFAGSVRLCTCLPQTCARTKDGHRDQPSAGDPQVEQRVRYLGGQWASAVEFFSGRL